MRPPILPQLRGAMTEQELIDTAKQGVKDLNVVLRALRAQYNVKIEIEVKEYPMFDIAGKLPPPVVELHMRLYQER